jgi:hypothetical protein
MPVASRGQALAEPEALAEFIRIMDWIFDEAEECRRRFGHHVLTLLRMQLREEVPPGEELHYKAEEAIESGLADYFACSFNDDSKLGEVVAERYAKEWGLEHPWIRNLDNDLRVDDTERRISDARSPQLRGEAWGGAFWELRTALGKERADKLLFRAWARDEAVGDDGSGFAEAVVEEAVDGHDDVVATTARTILEGRGLKLAD